MFEQDRQTSRLEAKIKSLEEKVKQLEADQEFQKNFFSLNEGEAVVKSFSGGAEIRMKKNGDISIKGMKVTIVGQSDVFVKSSSDVILKGSRIGAN